MWLCGGGKSENPMGTINGSTDPGGPGAEEGRGVHFTIKKGASSRGSH
jgi:hypothetical protein